MSTARLQSASLPASPVSSEPVWASAFSRYSFAFTLAGEHGVVVAGSLHRALPEAACIRCHRSSTGVAGRCWSCMWLGPVVVPTEQAATRSGTAAALSCVTQLYRISKPSWRVDGHATITLRWHRPSSLAGSEGHERPCQWRGCHQHHCHHLQSALNPCGQAPSAATALPSWLLASTGWW